MSDKDFLVTELNWDDEESLVDRTEPPSGRHHFAHLRLHVANVTKTFEPGKYVTVPGVVGGNFNEKDENGNMKFKGWIQGGKRKLYILVATKQDQDRQDYQIVKQYKSQKDRGDVLHLWADFVMPAIKKLPEAERTKLMSDGIYTEFDDLPTGETFKSDDGETHDIQYWGDFVIHPSQEALTKASDEFFGQFNGTAVNADNGIYPDSWKADVQAMVDYVKQLNGEGKSYSEIVESAMIIGRTTSGEMVNPVQVLSTILDVPEPMIEL